MKPSRRQFLQQSASLAALAAVTPASSELAIGLANPPATPWYRHAYRRAVIDMHIPDWDPGFLARFDPLAYAEALVTSRAQSIVCYAMSHVGLFNYPTAIGTPHAAFRDRDVLGEMIEACHNRGIAVVLYVSLIFDRVTADKHPDWRMRTHEGKFQGEGGRHGLLCPTNPDYRKYVHSFITELIQRYPAVEGLRCDMTFWPGLCFCEHCQRRFELEVGGDIPRVIDWYDPHWVSFQRCREKWLVEFASVATLAAKKAQPAITVEHQSSTYPLNWMFGVTRALTAQNDFLQGDFYGDRLQGSFVRKLLEDLTPHLPFAYETSVSVELKDHTARKPEALLEAKAAAAISDHAAFVFIDAIDPVGTVNPLAHERMGRVFDRLIPYQEHLGGERLADIGLYYSTESKFDFAGNGRPVSSPDTADSHTESAMKVASRLLKAHAPFRVVTRDRLSEKLSRLKVLILPWVNMMSDDEVAAIRSWVHSGGSILASGPTSLVTTEGKLLEDFALGEVFGVSLAGPPDWKGRNRYLSPTEVGARFFPEHTKDYPAFATLAGLDVTLRPDAVALATRTLPWAAPDPSRFGSIHSDPPWKPTSIPELVLNSFGSGRAVYAASPIERLDGLESSFNLILKELCPDPWFKVSAPGCVEATLFNQAGRKRLVFTLANFQAELPNLPVLDIEVSLRTPGPVLKVYSLPAERDVDYEDRDPVIHFRVPRLDTLAMFGIDLA